MTAPPPPPPPRAVDPLGEALHHLRPVGRVYAHSELSAPWGMELPPMEGHMMFHVVTEGECWLEADGSAPLALREGSLALIPHGLGHRLVASPGEEAVPYFDLPLEPIGENYESLRYGGGGDRCGLVCVVVRFDHAAADRLLDALPPCLHLDAWTAGSDRWLADSMKLIAREARAVRPGGAAIIRSLADVLLVQLIRQWIEAETPVDRGWLAALRHERLGRAIAAIHRNPAHGWTVDTLAREAAMSRSAFAAAFTDVIGEPAMGYVARWRLQLARESLRTTGLSLGEIALRVGYRSEASFSRAYKREFGRSPGADRSAD